MPAFKKVLVGYTTNCDYTDDMVKRVATLVLSIMLLATQTLGVAAHCMSLNSATGHTHAVVDSGEPSHSVDDGTAYSADFAGLAADFAASTHEQSDPQTDFDLTNSNCTLGCVGAVPIGQSRPDSVLLKSPFDSGPAKISLGATPAQPTPPPNATL